MILDIIIPTCKTQDAVAKLVTELETTAGLPCRVIATCQQASAAVNRNYGLDFSDSDPVVMVDDDMEKFPQGWAAQLVDALAKYPKCVMVSARLIDVNGNVGVMMGAAPYTVGEATIAAQRKLPTACVAFRRNDLRFDEAYIGSGFEDDDYCCQLRERFPCAEFRVVNDVKAVHHNEQKNQRGKFWESNHVVFKRKWGSHGQPRV